MSVEAELRTWDSLLDEAIFSARAHLLKACGDDTEIARVWIELGQLVATRQTNEVEFGRDGSDVD